MNRSELIDAVAAKTGASKKVAGEQFSAVLDVISESMAKGESVALVGFGTFEVRERPARTGRNPKSGEAMQIAAKKTPAFKPGKSLKDAVQA